jgi:hypothetical protein
LVARENIKHWYVCRCNTRSAQANEKSTWSHLKWWVKKESSGQDPKWATDTDEGSIQSWSEAKTHCKLNKNETWADKIWMNFEGN